MNFRKGISTVLSLLIMVFSFVNISLAQSKKYQELQKKNHAYWKKMLEKVNVQLPDSLPPPAEDPNRPDGTFLKKDSSGWTDSAGNTYARGPWGKWTNYDEAKASPYTKLPDPLVLDNGKKVTTPEIWWKQKRPEIKRAFNREIFGEVPENIPSVNWKIVSKSDTTIGDIPALKKEVVGQVDNSSYPKVSVNIELTVVTPAKVHKPVPAMIHFGFNFPPGFHLPKSFGKWKEQVLRRGWGYVNYIPNSVQPDNAAGLTQGIIGLVNKGKLRDPDDWGVLRAWAWGASRTLDYLQTDPDVDGKKVGVEGVSRNGKAALVAMAYDPRFAIVLVGSSGKGGAVLYRRNFGETIGILSSSSEYHWFAGNFIKYAGPLDATDLDIDSHELIAMCAPRPVFISVGSPKEEGRWVDDKGQFMAETAAGPAYQLLGKKGLGTQTMPPMETALMDGELAFRQHSGGHTDAPNWPYFLKFAERYLEKSE
ncbi:MAG TPA: hypothetical protein VJ964_09475 [Balneolaceae bacterium]|nr:hypothetical protein [Balneolaceae bacterium]